MDTFTNLMHGFDVAITFQNIGLALIGCFLGTIIGALPGLGPSNGVAILMPLAFSLGLGPTPALILLTSVYYGAMYGGRISSILLNIPGDEPALMTTLDGYPMARAGRAGEALAISGIASFVGSVFATIGLALLAPQLVKVALLFGPAEYFALFALAFATLGGISSTNQAKSAWAAAFGLGIAMIGVDGQTGVPRFSFGFVHLYDGIDFLVAIVGLFALSEVLIFLEHSGGTSVEAREAQKARPKIAIGRPVASFSLIRFCTPAMARSTVIGFLAGVLPGAGASLGSFMAYAAEKQISNGGKTFGKGDPRGVAAPEAGNNAAAGGALVPMLALGVPGSGTTAVLLAVLLSLNVTPGPLLFTNNPDIVWGLIAALFIANVMLLALNLPLVGLFARVLLIPPKYLMPLVAMVSFVGIYGVSGSTFDLLVMVLFGVIGWGLRKFDIPLVPIIMGILLGNLMEANLRRAMTISNGDWSALFGSPLAIGLWLFAAVGFVLPMLVGRKVKAGIEHAREEARDLGQ
ncbi:MAG: tripartite tricarboxylate transporter permease [Cypionkella sp.]